MNWRDKVCMCVCVCWFVPASHYRLRKTMAWVLSIVLCLSIFILFLIFHTIGNSSRVEKWKQLKKSLLLAPPLKLIPASLFQEEEDDGGTTLGKKGGAYTAPQLFLNEMVSLVYPWQDCSLYYVSVARFFTVFSLHGKIVHLCICGRIVHSITTHSVLSHILECTWPCPNTVYTMSFKLNPFSSCLASFLISFTQSPSHVIFLHLTAP